MTVFFFYIYPLEKKDFKNQFIYTMIKKLHYVLLTFLLIGSYSFSQVGLGTLKGTVRDEVSKEPLPYSKVLIKQNGKHKGNALTDFDGKFQINAVQLVHTS